ncbi:MAG: hypothetical protein QOJ29_3870 [Thermoleophilaceae bacterium]|jgi:uracil-DNA glycosylase|nr:hypothetical protein [Thermoleophilaceae bacterium]
MATDHLVGRFPFGQISGRCEPRQVADADALVLGVYPSAFHVRWSHPDYRVAALAVDQEPWPFWDGDDQDGRVAVWREAVGWKSAWGSATPAGRLNGSSGVVLRDTILGALGIAKDRAWLTDAVPFFHVHRGPGTQGAAMSDRYDEFARSHGLLVHQLPKRPPPDALIRYAIDNEGNRLRAEIAQSRAPLVITLGNEALAVAAAVLRADLPEFLSHDSSYGLRHPVHIDGRSIEVLALVHPGQRAAVWTGAHDRWRAAIGR